MDGGAWWAAVHGVANSQTRLSDFTFTFHFHALEEGWSENLALADANYYILNGQTTRPSE